MPDKPATQEYPAIWLQGAGCSGCSVSVLNAASPTIGQLVLDEVAPGKHVSLRFHPTVMAATGRLAVDILLGAEQADAPFLLVLEGSVPTAISKIGGCGPDGQEMDFTEHFTKLAQKAMAVVAIGDCAAFGGIPASGPNLAGCKSARQVMAEQGIKTPLINLGGCPPHPDWFMQTVASGLLFGLPDASQLDADLRPKMFYGALIHENCPRRPDFDAGKFARAFGEPGCMFELGCKGPYTYADCPQRKFNNGVNWCIQAGSPCHGCAESEFPNLGPGLYRKIDVDSLPRIEKAPDGTLTPVVPGPYGSPQGA
jgi:hydrogenase small subunit